MDAAVIDQYRGWLRKVATQLLSASSPDIDDLIQEGRIAMWKALDTYNPSRGSLPYWLTNQARYHMVDVVINSKRWTGTPSRLKGRNAYEEIPTVSLDKPIGFEGEQEITLADSYPGPSYLEGVELSYHRSDIRTAVESLTPAQRRYVAARFGQGMNYTELTAHFGYDPSGLWNSPKNGAKYKLREQLAHLESAA